MFDPETNTFHNIYDRQTSKVETALSGINVSDVDAYWTHLRTTDSRFKEPAPRRSFDADELARGEEVSKLPVASVLLSDMMQLLSCPRNDCALHYLIGDESTMIQRHPNDGYILFRVKEPWDMKLRLKVRKLLMGEPITFVTFMDYKK